ncbi:hypothetical protein SAMD00019534_104210 [Acytostelium subglobosum LB1]|uniref:hypothetical protein n=1 Tax=Acytostelium subglobosum LB1 TaxID=1410327 RepID=UPI000644EADD|nr:hypothetical protein SAMD00019534_104210 [Acytostelium subglobosum LB1]GAM27246.1 hypothetical protein SAMD00019534_104210 [Acytostelium subglobosum LB1]|eukprot:XP_012749713.1 hypothetical protein SAMD00019534_104210 [Acytostelium subglobosum LB1]
MPIIYSLVSRGSSVLAEYTNTTGNFQTITRRILDLIPPNETKMSYTYEKYNFHYLVHNTLTFLCMADHEFGQRIPFLFLEDIKNRFMQRYGDSGRTALAYAMNTEFSSVLEQLMDQYNNKPKADSLSRTQAQVDEVKQYLISDVAPQLLKRGEKIEILVDKTENMVQESFKFKKQSKQLKCTMWWKNFKLTLIIAAVVAIIIFIIVLSACGGFSFHKCRK